MTQRESDDDAWRAIVDNYGDRAELDHDVEDRDDREDPAPRGVGPVVDPDDPTAGDAPGDRAAGPTAHAEPEEERFVPPPPPPLPRPPADRLAAWTGVFGAPAVLLACLLLGIDLPDLAAYGLVAAFVGGFLYLVFRMPRGPRDPWDDGARV